MQTKLTLRLDDELIKRAKQLAQKRGKSLSKMVSEYFDYLASFETEKETRQLSPIVKSLRGALADSEMSEKDYEDYLERKYL